MNTGDAGAGGLPVEFVSRGGLKLAHALDTFSIDVRGMACADLGCSTGGFTDCLLRCGAASVVSVDTGYGVLAYKLRTDPRVKVMERTNALHAEPSVLVDVVVMDVSWTPMRHAVPAAVRWLRPGGVLIALIKPHYERSSTVKRARGILSDSEGEEIAAGVLKELAVNHPGLTLIETTRSPIKGGGGKHKEGNPEWLAAWRVRRAD